MREFGPIYPKDANLLSFAMFRESYQLLESAKCRLYVIRNPATGPFNGRLPFQRDVLEAIGEVM